MRSPHLVIRTDARACRPIIPDPSRAHPSGPRPAPPRRRTPRLLAYPAGVPDPRAARGRRHPLVAILGLTAAAVLAGARSIAAIAEWAAEAPQPVRVALGARQQAPGHRSVPAEATIRRTLARLDPDAVAGAIGAWLADRDRHLDGDRGRPAAGRRAVAVDGKTLRGAHPPDGDGRPVHLLAAMDHQRRAVLAQRQVGGAPEEVPAFAPLLAPWTLPAWWSPPMGCRPTPRPPGFLVTGKQAHYLLVVKANQPLPLDRCARLPWHRVPVADRTRDRGHGRVEHRSLKAVSVRHFGFPHAAQVVQVTANGASCTPTGGRR
jgi:DDE_Tnp_1-associated